MKPIDARVVDVGDPPPFEASAPLHKVELERFAVLEQGMQSGRASVAFVIQLPDGSTVFAETSARLFLSLAAITRGALQRWGEEE